MKREKTRANAASETALSPAPIPGFYKHKISVDEIMLSIKSTRNDNSGLAIAEDALTLAGRAVVNDSADPSGYTFHCLGHVGIVTLDPFNGNARIGYSDGDGGLLSATLAVGESEYERLQELLLRRAEGSTSDIGFDVNFETAAPFDPGKIATQYLGAFEFSIRGSLEG